MNFDNRAIVSGANDRDNPTILWFRRFDRRTIGGLRRRTFSSDSVGSILLSFAVSSEVVRIGVGGSGNATTNSSTIYACCCGE